VEATAGDGTAESLMGITVYVALERLWRSAELRTLLGAMRAGGIRVREDAC
jgi:hypothetical protein